MKIKIDIIYGDAKHNHMMHAFDVFENSKQLATHDALIVEAKEGVKLHELTTNIKNSFEASGQNVIFVSIRQVGPTMTNDYDRYIKPGVSSLSNGHKWGLFKNNLESLGYKVETDKHMRVTDVELTW